MALAMAAHQNRFRKPLTAKHLSLLFWCCWILAYAGVYSYLSGIIHFYYLSTMAPALAALAGIGIVSLWTEYRQRSPYGSLLPVALLLTAAWQLYIQASALGWRLSTFTGPSASWQGWLHGALIGGTIAAAAGLTFIFFRPLANQAIRVISLSSLVLGLLALLVVPLAWTLSTVLLPTPGLLPSADLYRMVVASRGADVRLRSRLDPSVDIPRLVAFLKANRKGERYLIATSTAQLAAPIIIDTGQAVMARGGFHGLDPAVTPETLAQMVAARQVRFAMMGDVAIVSRRMGARAAGKQVAGWVRANGKLVDPALWRTIGSRDSMQLYDLRPETGLVPISSPTGRPEG
jgi:4-amino-4-deoxy-L-arabinose transferase-like glycosyltransferase